MASKKFLAVIVAFVALSPLEAFAYLDPGSGSAILQGVLGALAAIVVVLKLYWHRFLRLLGIRKKTDSNTISTEAEKSDNRS